MKNTKTAGILLAACAVAVMSGTALAHSWYSYACCTGRDCEAIPAGSVEDLGAQGYRVTYTSPMFGAVRVMVPRDKKKDSEDGRDHFCGYRVGDEIKPRCLYLAVNS